jgi:ATP-dependent Clp protease ATP-binding subunit ClpC
MFFAKKIKIILIINKKIMSYNNFSDWFKKVLINAENNIKNIWLKELNIEDVFIELIKNSTWWIKEIFDLYWINEKLAIEIINKWLFNEAPDKRKWVYAWMSPRLKNCILWSVKIAASFSKAKASQEDFLISMLKNDAWFTSFLDYIWIIPSDLESNINNLNKIWIIDWIKWWEKNNNKNIGWEAIDQLLWNISQNLFWWMVWANPQATPFDSNKQNMKKEESTTPALDFFSVDLTKEAKEWKIDNILGRDTEVERMIAILNRKTKNNPVLVWEPWVGKTAIAEWLALKIVSWQVPFSMKDKKVLALDLSWMVAWTKYRWEFETRIKQVIDEASKVENEIILFIDEIHTIIWAWGWEWTLDASNILKPAMWRWKIRVIW